MGLASKCRLDNFWNIPFVTTPDESFVSWKSFLFFVPGTFIAAFVWGLLFYLIQRSLAGIFTKAIGLPESKTVTFIVLIGIGLMIIQVVLVYLSARNFIEASLE